MKIEKLSIKGLFKTFNYDIRLSEGSSPLILTGLNGYGKTTILTIIKRLSEKDFFYFYRLPFEEIKLTFDDGAKVVLSSKEGEAQTEDGEESDYDLTAPRIVEFAWISNQNTTYAFQLGKEEIEAAVRALPWPGGGIEKDINSEGFYKLTLHNKSFYGNFSKDENFTLMSMMLDSLKVTFITAQRLEPIEETVYVDYPYETETIHKPKITAVSQLIKERLDEEKIKFLNKSQYIDGKLLDSLLADTSSSGEAEYNALREKVSCKIADLKAFGLVNNITILPYGEEHKHILSVYLKNMDEKLQTYDSILSKLKLFREKVGSLRLVNKTISYSPDKGLCIQTPSGLFLEESKLSSGEQNEIVMLYEMIFEVADNTVLLIDEPEISLHVAWQNKFLDMMTEVASINNLQVVVATHSPQIIGDRWEECYDLCEHARDE